MTAQTQHSHLKTHIQVHNSVTGHVRAQRCLLKQDVVASWVTCTLLNGCIWVKLVQIQVTASQHNTNSLTWERTYLSVGKRHEQKQC